MSTRKNVLFLTNCEHGQANVVLAVAYELLQSDDVEVHIASWKALESRVVELGCNVSRSQTTSKTNQLRFHVIPGSGMLDAVYNNYNVTRDNLPHQPGYAGTARFRELAPQMLAPWSPVEHINMVNWFGDLVIKLDPALVVVDPFLSPAHDLVRKMQREYLVLSPCSLASGLIPTQPWLAGFWKYPGIATGFSYPLPWSKLPESIYCILNAISILIFEPTLKTLSSIRRSQGINGQLATFEPYVKDVPHISPSLPEIDLPMKIPANAHFVGPILLPEQGLSETDPELLRWLQKGPTVLLNLGTHHENKANQARGQALGLRMLLDQRPDVQVLWKFKAAKGSTADKEIETILGQDIKDGRVRLEGWLKSEPLSVLRSGCVIAAVHHGGANSWFEATWSGTPQVILAQWYDTYDYACKVEYLGIGVYGNKTVAPMVDEQEFGEALLKIVGKAGQQNELQAKAVQVGQLCRESGGRRLAAKLITAYALQTLSKR